jgi:hypothetical protein
MAMDSQPYSSIPRPVLVAVGLIGCCLSLLLFQYIRCSGLICFPDRNFTVLNLSLPLGLFPEGSIGGEMQLERSWRTESGLSTVYWGNGQGLAIYIVDQYDKLERAANNYPLILIRQDYSKHEQLTYRSSTADGWSLDCGFSEFGGYRCRLVARYEEFILFFHATITDDMPIERFEQIVIFLDEQMTHYLQAEVKS